MRDNVGFSCDLCVLAVHQHIPESQVCVVWVHPGVASLCGVGTATVEVFIGETCLPGPHVEHGHCYMKQSLREVASIHHGPKHGSDGLSGSPVESMGGDVVLHSHIIIQDIFEKHSHVMASCPATNWKGRPDIRHFLFPVWQDDHWAGVEIQMGGSNFGIHGFIPLLGQKHPSVHQVVCPASRNRMSHLFLPVALCCQHVWMVPGDEVDSVLWGC